MLMVNLMLFGAAGLTIWAVQMAWIPVTAAGVINGIGHYWGYRNFACADASTNIVPWGILIGGEELHNNHHAYGTSAKLSSRWYEFDLGWTLHPHSRSRWASPKCARSRRSCKVAPAGKPTPDVATLQAVIAQPLRGRDAPTRARSKATCATELARLRERAGRGDFADVPSMRQPEALALRRHDRRAARARARARWRGRWRKAARCRRSTRCARS